MVVGKHIAKLLAVTTLITAITAGSYSVCAFESDKTGSVGINSLNYADFDAGRVIVVFKEGYKASAESKELQGIKLKNFENLLKAKKPNKDNGVATEEIKKKETFLLTLEDSSKDELTSVLNKLNNEPAVEYAIPDFAIEFKSNTFDNKEYSKQYAMDLIGAPKAWDKTNGSPEIVVGVIDTGIDYNHPDLQRNMWVNPGETGFTQDGVDKSKDGVDNDGNGYVDDVYGYDFGNSVGDIIDSDPIDDLSGHGTHCAGIIAAAGNIKGVSSNTKVAALKISNDNLEEGLARYSAAIKAIDYANAMGFQITSNSWGVEQLFLDIRKLNQEWTELAPLMRAAVSKGGLFVAAAGNSNTNTDLFPVYPGAFNLDNVIVVANTNSNDELSDNSNYGKNFVDLSAPGNSIYSTLPDGQYGLSDGTSMATPHVAGAAALLLSANSSLTPAQLKGIIVSSVDHVEGLKVKSEGRLNVTKALDKVMGSVLIGDLNNDEIVNASDHEMLSKHLSGVQPLTSAQQKVAADLNGDGLINEMDNVVMRYYIPGLISRFPAGKIYAFTYGDVNKDGAVTSEDMALVLKYRDDNSKDLESKQFLAADVNGDNIINVLDAGLIQQYINEMILNLPVGNK